MSDSTSFQQKRAVVEKNTSTLRDLFSKCSSQSRETKALSILDIEERPESLNQVKEAPSNGKLTKELLYKIRECKHSRAKRLIAKPFTRVLDNIEINVIYVIDLYTPV